MRSPELLLNDLLPSSCIRLGRLVLNTKVPHQDFLDPLDDRPTEAEYNTNRQKNFEETRKFSKNSKLRSYLTDILSISYGAQNERITSLAAPQITTHLLGNSGTWFEEACARPGTRKWIENAIDSNRTVHLVVGFRILEDAKFARNITWDTVKGARAEVPVHSLAAGVASMALSSNTGAGGSLDSSYEQRRVFDVPGEHIFAVQYRKIKFKWLSSRTLSNTILENTRWKASWDWRGGSGDEGEDEDEDEDVLEVELTDASDMEISDEEYLSEDETARTVFPPNTSTAPDDISQISDTIAPPAPQPAASTVALPAPSYEVEPLVL